MTMKVEVSPVSGDSTVVLTGAERQKLASICAITTQIEFHESGRKDVAEAAAKATEGLKSLLKLTSAGKTETEDDEPEDKETKDDK
jgi:hypothetical protein